MAATERRRGSDTKAEIVEVALELFTAQGYDATSLREVADRLSITKAALYYHFSSKADIVRAFFEDYLEALSGLATWAREQPPGPGLRLAAVDRMIDLVTGEGLPVMHFALANPRVLRDLEFEKGSGLVRLTELVEIVAGPDAPVEEQVRLRAALLSVNTVLAGAQGLEVSRQQIAAIAREIAHQLVGPERAS